MGEACRFCEAIELIAECRAKDKKGREPTHQEIRSEQDYLAERIVIAAFRPNEQVGPVRAVSLRDAFKELVFAIDFTATNPPEPMMAAYDQAMKTLEATEPGCT